jgi:vacuolar-type H+-ATPase subunit C/Vma6
MGKLKKSDRRTAERICAEEISLRNCAWILRLRTYYRMKGEELKSYLISPPGRPELSRDALEAVELPLDSRVEWKRWKRIHFLNGEASPSGEFQRSENWQADPGYFQNAASVYLYKLALHGFRTRPSSIDTCFCFIKLKQFEEDLLTSEAEGIAMGMTSRDVFGILETET